MLIDPKVDHPDNWTQVQKEIAYNAMIMRVIVRELRPEQDLIHAVGSSTVFAWAYEFEVEYQRWLESAGNRYDGQYSMGNLETAFREFVSAKLVNARLDV